MEDNRSQNEIVRALMERDGESLEDAMECFLTVQKQALTLVDEGSSMTEVEELLQEELGLEPDYILELLTGDPLG